MPESKNIANTEDDPVEIEIEIDFDDLDEIAPPKGGVDGPDVATLAAAQEPVAEQEPVAAQEPVAEQQQDASEDAEDAEDAVLDDIASAIAASIGELSPEAVVAPDQTSQDLSSPVAPRLTEPSTIKSADKLNFRLVGIKAWKVKVKIGLVYDFSDIKTLHKYIKDGRVTNEDTISHNGKDWTTIGDIPDLEAHFIAVYLEAEKNAPAAPRAAALVTANDTIDNSLTGDIMAQITQESLSAVDADTPVGPDFIDPFAELKKKQRTRIKQRDNIRTMHKEASKTNLGLKNKKNILLVMLASIAVYLILSNGEPEVTTSDAIEPESIVGGPSDDLNDRVASSSRDAQVAAINERLQAIQAEVDAENESSEPNEEVRTYVQPNSPTQQRGNSNATQEPPGSPQAVAPPTQIIQRGTPATRARDAYLNQNWSAAQDAYTQAFNTTRDPQMILGIGKSLFHLGNYRGAEERLLAADQAGAMDQEGLRFLAQIYIDRGDPMGANTYQQRLR